MNDLNADPYSVFLLDEAEKCHPNIWKPFLNLFDEGWIVDQRGVKAYADRAIFILTSNAGDKAIADMSRQGKSETEIINRVRATLSRIRHERSSQPVFPPQFLSRIKRIAVFSPLSESAMTAITRKILRQIATLWEQKRERKVIVSNDLVSAIGRLAHSLNEQSNGQEGGRIVRKLIGDEIELRIQLAATEYQREYQECHTIVVSCRNPHADSEFGIDVQFKSE